MILPAMSRMPSTATNYDQNSDYNRSRSNSDALYAAEQHHNHISQKVQPNFLLGSGLIDPSRLISRFEHQLRMRENIGETIQEETTPNTEHSHTNGILDMDSRATPSTYEDGYHFQRGCGDSSGNDEDDDDDYDEVETPDPQRPLTGKEFSKHSALTHTGSQHALNPNSCDTLSQRFSSNSGSQQS